MSRETPIEEHDRRDDRDRVEERSYDSQGGGPETEPGDGRDRSEHVEPRPSRISRGRLSSLEGRQ